MRNTLLLFIAAWLLSSFVCFAAGQDGQSRISVGGRMHVAHDSFKDLPFDDGDISYGIAYEWHDAGAYWQIAVDYAPDVGGQVGEATEGAPAQNEPAKIDAVLTPQLNLIMKDQTWRGGIGLLRSYISGDNIDDWTKIYWQFIFGVNLPVFFAGGLDLHAFYVFKDWNALSDFSAQDVDFGIWASFSF